MSEKPTRLRRPWDLGTWMWLLNRIAGVACILFLLAHICVISTTRLGEPAFDAIMTVMHNPLAVFLEFVLIMGVLAHGLNGLRHMAVEFGLFSPEKHGWLARIGMCVMAVVFIIAAGWMLV